MKNLKCGVLMGLFLSLAVWVSFKPPAVYAGPNVSQQAALDARTGANDSALEAELCYASCQKFRKHCTDLMASNTTAINDLYDKKKITETEKNTYLSEVAAAGTKVSLGDEYVVEGNKRWNLGSAYYDWGTGWYYKFPYWYYCDAKSEWELSAVAYNSAAGFYEWADGPSGSTYFIQGRDMMTALQGILDKKAGNE